MSLHPVSVAFNLQNDKIIVSWPWGSHSFGNNPEELADLGEALRNYAIQRSRREHPDRSISHDDLLTIRRLIETTEVVAKRYVPGSSGKREVPKLSDFLDDDDFKDII